MQSIRHGFGSFRWPRHGGKGYIWIVGDWIDRQTRDCFIRRCGISKLLNGSQGVLRSIRIGHGDHGAVAQHLLVGVFCC